MAEYIITVDRRLFIEENFFEWSFGKPDGYLPDKNLFRQLAHPAELHYLANIYNWDDGATVLEWLLDSEQCTRSTANLLFWRAAPDWYLRCDIDDEASCPSINLDGFKVLRKIVDKYKSNSFSEFQIAFDPSGETESIYEKNPKWSFPPGVYDVIAGVEVVVEE